MAGFNFYSGIPNGQMPTQQMGMGGGMPQGGMNPIAPSMYPGYQPQAQALGLNAAGAGLPPWLQNYYQQNNGNNFNPNLQTNLANVYGNLQGLYGASAAANPYTMQHGGGLNNTSYNSWLNPNIYSIQDNQYHNVQKGDGGSWWDKLRGVDTNHYTNYNYQTYVNPFSGAGVGPGQQNPGRTY